MVKMGYALSSEEHSPQKLVDLAQQAEKSGFGYAFISDHYHPWIDQQGQSPFVWDIIGAISQKTRSIRLGTGVTCPIIRLHPAIIAQAAATSASLMENRFMLGLGTGENLNEHITGSGWPPINIRLEMITEAIKIIRLLWKGGYQSFNGEFFTVDKARLYTLPRIKPYIYMAASGPKSAAVAGRLADGLISTVPDKNVVKAFNSSGGRQKPKFGQLAVCIDKDEKTAIKTVIKWWPQIALSGPESQEYRLPSYFQKSSRIVKEEDIAKSVICGADVDKHIEAINSFIRAGFQNIYIHQIGPEQESFFRFYREKIIPLVS